MPTWPAALPCPLAGTYNEAPPLNTIRSQMDVGPEKVRRRTTANTAPISYTMSLTPANVTVLLDFYNQDTVSGSLPFDYTHPRTGAAVQARFVNVPQIRNQGIRYAGSVELEIMP